MMMTLSTGMPAIMTGFDVGLHPQGGNLSLFTGFWCAVLHR
jgi:hypothetical protein